MSKSGLFKSLRAYHTLHGTNLWDSVPVTFYLKAGVHDDDLTAFLAVASGGASGADESPRPQPDVGPAPIKQASMGKAQFWIVKPASATTRGTGYRREICNRGPRSSKPGNHSER